MTRQERVEELTRKEICEILRKKVNDPRIGFVSVTAVAMSTDLENASIFVSIFGNDQQKKAAMQGLYSATKFIRGELGQRLELRKVPQIRFIRDDSLERGSKILGLINRLKNERTLPGNKKSPKKG